MSSRFALSALALALLFTGAFITERPAAARTAPVPPPVQDGPSGAAPPDLPPLSRRAQVSLLTILPGDGAADAFGHSALRVRDPALHLDRTYNYGTYRFGPYFIPKFVYGQLTYLLSTSPFQRLLRRYRLLERPVIEHTLNLSRAQEQRLFQFLEWNARPQHRAYRYDFLFDNCATRPRDALRDALGDPLHFDLEALPRRTFRHHLDRYVADKTLLDLGFDLALGLPTDRVATPTEAMFLPEYLMEGVAGATLGRGADRRPLAAPADTLFWVEGRSFPAQAAFPWPTVLLWAFFAGLLGLTAWRFWHGHPPLRGLDAALFGAVGLASIVIWFLAFFSEHTVTRYNLNVLWILPTHLGAALALAWRRAPGRRYLRGYLLASGTVALLLALGWPLWPQDLHAAALPLVLALALRSFARALHRGRPRRPPQASAPPPPSANSAEGARSPR